jgi:MFS family permease
MPPPTLTIATKDETAFMSETAPPAAPEMDAQGYPHPVYAWLVVILLTVAYALSLLDRWVLTLLVTPIKAALNVSDTAMGLLMGPIFAVVYVLLGLPFGWAADRYNRRNIAAAGISMWCAMTVLSGTARHFTTLAFCRFGIGFGEAALTPAASSLIADSFPRKQVNAALGVFNLGIYGGMGLSYLIGAALLGWATANVGTLLGAGWSPWQLVFMAVGVPGFIVAALLMILVREPQRRRGAIKQNASMRDCFAYIKRHRGAYVPLAVGMGTVAMTGYSFTWLPTLFTRVWDWPIQRFSFIYGILLLVCGPLGTVLGGVIANRLYARGMKDAPYRVIAVGLPILVVIAGTAPLMPSPYLAVCALGVAAFFSSMSTSAGVSSVVFATPSEYRGRTLALYTMTNSMIGTIVGPAGVGFLSDHVYTGQGGIRYSLATILLVVGGGLTAYLLTGRRAYDRAVIELEQGMAA